MATDTLAARREIAWLDAGLGQRMQVREALAAAAMMAMILAKDSRDDIAAIQRTYDHLVALFAGQPSKLDPDDALITISVVFSALSFGDQNDKSAIERDRARCNRLEREQLVPRGFPKLYFHKPPRRVNDAFPGVLVCKAGE